MGQKPDATQLVMAGVPIPRKCLMNTEQGGGGQGLPLWGSVFFYKFFLAFGSFQMERAWDSV